MQVSSRLIVFSKSILKKTQSFSISSRKSWFCSNISQQPNNIIKADEEIDDVKRITSILYRNRRRDWLPRIDSYRNNLNPCLLQSVFEQNRSCDPDRLYAFFKWSSTHLAVNGTSQTLVSFLILYKYFFDLGHSTLQKAKHVIKHMLKTNKPPVSDVLDAIKSVGLTSCQLSQLIYIYTDNFMLDEAVLIVLNYVDYCLPSLVCLNVLMTVLRKNDKMDLFWKVYERLVRANVTLDKYIYSHVISAYCKCGQIEDAKRIYLEMLDRDCSPDEITCGLLIRGLCKLGLVNEALDYEKSMMENGFIHGPCIDTIFRENSLTGTQLAVLDDLNKAAGLVPNDAVTYNSVINGFMKEGKLEEASRLLDEMIVAKNCHRLSTLWCINNVMKELLERNKLELFWKVYEKMLTNKDLRPDDLTYNNLIDAYVRDGKVKEAKKLFFQIVKNKGFTPSLVTYNVLISELCKIGYVLTAFKIKKSMKNKGLKTDRCAYNNLIVGLCKRKRTRDAKLLFNEMAFKIKDETVAQGLEVSFDKPTIKAYTSLLRSYIKSRDKAKIFTFVRDLAELGIPKNQVLSDLLLDGFSNEYSFEKTLKLLDELVAKELCCRSIFDRLLYYFCKKGKFYEAMVCIDEVKQRGVTISPGTCKALAAGLKNRGYKPTMLKQ